MSEAVQDFIVRVFANNPVLATIVIAMIPIIELRGAIPFGSSKEIWGDKALTIFEASVYSLIGSLISAVLIVLLLIPVFNYLKKTKFLNSLVNSFEEKFSKEKNKIEEKTTSVKYKGLKKWLGVVIFVAIPLPLTGVWTGSAIAVFLQLGFIKSFTAVSLGALIAALVVSLISFTLNDKALIIFYVFCILFIVLIIFYIIKALLKKDRSKNDKEKMLD